MQHYIIEHTYYVYYPKNYYLQTLTSKIIFFLLSSILSFSFYI